MKITIQNYAAGVFIACVSVLSVVSVLGVWKVFEGDVILKSVQTLGLLALMAIVVVVASRFMGDSADPAETVPSSPAAFRAVRNITLVVLIASAVLLALLSVLAIWDVIEDAIVVSKSLSSVAILCFSSLIIVMVCLEREGTELWRKRGRQLSGGAVLGGIILVWILLSVLI